MNRSSSIDLRKSMEQLVGQAVWQAKLGSFPGQLTSARVRKYFDDCRWWHPDTGTNLWFTRDVGHHTSGWWKNPMYDRCLHLSLSFWEVGRDEGGSHLPVAPRPPDRRLTKEWVSLFFKEWENGVVCEGPYSEEGKKLGVWHYRLFCSPNWMPWIPLGEVYSRQYTEAGWMSWSERRGQMEVEEQALIAQLMEGMVALR